MSEFTEEEVTEQAIEVGGKFYEVLIAEFPDGITGQTLMAAIQGLGMAAGALIAQAMERSANPIKLRRVLLDFLLAHAKKTSKVALSAPEGAVKH